MNIMQYRNNISEVNAYAANMRRIAGEEYARANSDIKIGDIITDHVGTIRVEVIKIYYSSPPQCEYVGVMLTKKGVPFKGGEKRTVIQENIGLEL